MSDLRPQGIPINIGGKEYGVLFSLNAIDAIQEHFDVPISELGSAIDGIIHDGKNGIKNLRWLLTLLINADIESRRDLSGEEIPFVDEAYVGRHISAGTFAEAMSAINKSMTVGAPKLDENAPNR